MKKINLPVGITFVFFYFLFSCTILNAQNKNIIWAHGLSGNATSWHKYGNYYQGLNNTNIDNVYVEYDMNGIVPAAENVKGDIVNMLGSEAHDAENNIYVSHSMGGIVGRQLHGTNAQTPFFNNMIASTAQHQGAPIAVSATEGDLEAYLTQGCTELSVAPSSGIGLGGIYMPFVCDLMSNIVFALFGDNYINTSLEDIRPDSPFMGQVVTLPTPTNKVGCIGIEDSPVHWRQFTSVGVPFATVENLDLNETKDEVLVNVMSFARFNYALMEGVNNFGALISIFPLTRKRYRRRAAQWKRGKDWIDGSEEGWNLEIGALSMQTTSVTIDGFLCQNELNSLYNTIAELEESGQFNLIALAQQQINELMCNPDCYGTETITTTQWVVEDSDGVVPVSTQVFPDTDYNYEMIGVNHQEARNHPEATAVYDNILLGGDAGEEFRIINQ